MPTKLNKIKLKVLNAQMTFCSSIPRSEKSRVKPSLCSDGWGHFAKSCWFTWEKQALYCIVLYCIVLYCIVLYMLVFFQTIQS